MIAVALLAPAAPARRPGRHRRRVDLAWRPTRSARSRRSLARCRRCGSPRTAGLALLTPRRWSLPHLLARRPQPQGLGRARLRDARALPRRAHRLGRPGVARPDRLLRHRCRDRRQGDRRLGPRPHPRARRRRRGRRASRPCVVGLPALRLRGLYLAVTTFAFSLATTSYLLNPRFFDWVPDRRVERPPLLGRIDIDSPTRIYYVCLGGLLLVLRRPRRASGGSRTGRALLALRDNERAAQAYGIDADPRPAHRLRPVRRHRRLRRLPVRPPPAGHRRAALLRRRELRRVHDGRRRRRRHPAGALLGALSSQGIRWFLPVEWQLLASGGGVLLSCCSPGGLGGLALRAPRRAGCRRSPADRGIDAPGSARAAEPAPAATAAAAARPPTAAASGAEPEPVVPPMSRHQAVAARTSPAAARSAAGRALRAQRRRRARPHGVRRPAPGDPRRVRPRPAGRAHRRRPRRPSPRCCCRCRSPRCADRHNRVTHRLGRRARRGRSSRCSPAWPPTLLVLGIARAGSGIGKAVVDPTHNSLIADYYDIPNRPRVFSFHRAANAVGAFVGPLVAGLLAAAYGWRAPVLRLRLPDASCSWSSPCGCSEPRARALRAQGDGRHRQAALDTEEPTPVVRRGVAHRVEDRDAAPDLVVAPLPRRRRCIGFVSLASLLYEEVFDLDERARGFVAAAVEPASARRPHLRRQDRHPVAGQGPSGGARVPRRTPRGSSRPASSCFALAPNICVAVAANAVINAVAGRPPARHLHRPRRRHPAPRPFDGLLGRVALGHPRPA